MVTILKGWFGFTIELWDAATEAGIKKDHYVEWNRWHPPEDELKLLQWNDENKHRKRGYSLATV